DPANGVRTVSSTVTVNTVNAGSASVLAVGTATQPLTITGIGDFGPSAAFTATALGNTRAFTIHNSSTVAFAVTTSLQAGTVNSQPTWWDNVTDCTTTVASGDCTTTWKFHPPTGAALGIATPTLQVLDN